MKRHQITYQNVPRETFSAVDKIIENNRVRLEAYLDQLLWWNKRINLVSRDVPRETVWKHIRHSLLLTQFECYKNSRLIVDSGTGGGLPGLPLSIISAGKEFILNDIVTKKLLAVKQIIQKLGLTNVVLEDKNVADLQVDTPFLLASKHAFKINDLYRFTSHLPWTGMVFYKGLNFEEELEDIDTSLSVIVHNLSEESDEEFFKDKAIIVVSRINR